MPPRAPSIPADNDAPRGPAAALARRPLATREVRLYGLLRPRNATRCTEATVLRTDDLDYHLPEDRIAVHPASPRDSARLMVVSRSDPALLLHRTVADLPHFLRPGDAMIVNTTRVLPARFRGERADTRGKVDVLYLAPPPGAERRGHWAVLLKGRRIKPGVVVTLFGRDGRPSGLALRIIERHHEHIVDPASRHDADVESGGWLAALEADPSIPSPPLPPTADAAAVLAHVGLTPLPPYIRQARKRREEPDTDAQRDARDQHDYQTVYSDPARTDSIAAPTAGLHFTPELLAKIDATGVQRAEVILHVGMGTFKPVETELVEQHPMHAEWAEVPASTASLIEQTRARRGRILAIGTTTARALESFPPGSAQSEGWTRLLITPGYRFRVIDALMTNFHLPRSTLMAMVAAMLDTGSNDGLPRLKALYEEAIRRNYRFYSFGDAMLILP